MNRALLRSILTPRPWTGAVRLGLVATVLLAGGAIATVAAGQSVTDPAPPAVEQAPAVDCTNLTPTPAQTEGPYFTPNSPDRASLVTPGMAGTPLVLTGAVVDTSCRPVAGALLDFWQADSSGAYDNRGYELRGHQYTDEQGRFRLETVVPGLYPGRTRHIHVKVQAPGGPVLTTQLYLPDEPRNARDGIFAPGLLMTVTDVTDAGVAATYTFVVRAP
jgi:protocatechuate 3,4-dioxygenase beta subunit